MTTDSEVAEHLNSLRDVHRRIEALERELANARAERNRAIYEARHAVPELSVTAIAAAAGVHPSYATRAIRHDGAPPHGPGRRNGG